MEAKTKSYINRKCWIAILLLALSVIPILWVGQYAHTVMDDFSYGATALSAMRQGCSWLAAAIKTAKSYYFSWQGTFSAVAMMSLVPSVWGEDYYFLTPFVMLISLVVGTFKLTDTLLRKVLKRTRAEAISVAAVILWISIEQLPSAAQAFYWWNGASYYMGFHSWAMLMTAVALCAYNGWESYGRIRKIILFILGGLGCIFLGGGNYLTALMLVLVLAGLALAALIKRKKSKMILGFYFLSTLAALVSSIAAPGNVAHMNYNFQNDISVSEAIYISIKDGLINIRDWSNVFVIMLYVFLLPFIWKLARNCPLKFRFPVLVTILSGGLYLAEYAPISYTFGGYAPGRIVNLYYWNYYGIFLYCDFKFI